MKYVWVGLCVSFFGCSSKPDLTVFAASSLTDAFSELSSVHEKRTGEKVRLVFGGSQTLRLQIDHGAPCDLFASASAEHAEGIGPVVGFATNSLVIITARDDERSADQLLRTARFVVGSNRSPIGIYTEQFFENVGVRPEIVSYETNVRLVRTKVALGDAEAGIVYRTDVDDTVRAVEIEERNNVEIRYVFAQKSSAARSWAKRILSDEGERVLSKYRFRSWR